MKIKLVPSENQIRGASFLVTRRAGGIVYATGSGKTLIQILAGFKLIRDKRTNKFLIFCTKSSIIEILDDYAHNTDVRPYVITDYAALEHYIHSDLQFGVLQYSTLAAMVAGLDYSDKVRKEWESSEPTSQKTVLDAAKLIRIQTLLAPARLAVSLDEMQTIKNPKSYTGTVFRALRQSFYYCYGATATTLMADIYDVYHLASFFNPSVLGSVHEFNENYLIRKSKVLYLAGGRRRPIFEIEGYKNIERLQESLAHVFHSYFPPYDIEFVRHPATLHNEKAYEEAARGVLRPDPNDTEFTEKRHSSRLLDLQEVVNRDRGKLTKLDDVIRSRLDKGTLLFCAFYKSIAVVERLLNLRNIPYKEISGRVADRRSVRDWFNKNPVGKVLIITRAGGQSLNLQSTPNMIFFDIPFGLGYFTQAMGRVVREYSDFKKFTIDFVCAENTIDDYKYNLIAANKDLLQRLFRNELVPPSERLTDFSQQIIDGLKKEFLWKRKEMRAKTPELI